MANVERYTFEKDRMVTVWTNGCFDILHRGHLEMLQYARSLGSKLIVGIDSDQKVREDKGSDRPINTQTDRYFMLQSLQCVDDVVIFNSREDLESLIQTIEPDIMVIGSDWRGKEVVGQQYATRLEFFDRVGDYSTTNMLESLKS